ncbi:DUF6953 family protein [Rhodococcus chondri]|uniref:Integron gene cassette protein n=1 Tax=Rhodococcus chondri TaxID=3065941 RepID=A0ABU7JZY9_9NOCA|nr:hypothetical protein [Rhodococcus sp. CC-R104]MEE2035584.1 hypothetical protein [Rhodococcus sp. CC-R104]
MSTTATDIATWMIDIITAEGKVTQEDMVDAIEAKFGADWVYVNDNGHTSIDRAVLKEFRKAHDGGIKWHREDRAWYIDSSSEAEPSEGK